ncbi:MAG: hypothetical protein Q9157_001172 [Trypethelium eluteriae]
MYLDSGSLSLIKGIILIGHGPDLIPSRLTVVHDIWKPAFSNGGIYAKHLLLDLQKSERLVKRVPRVTKDARNAFEAMTNNPSGVANPARVCFRIVITQGTRIVGLNEISDNPKLLESLGDSKDYTTNILISMQLITGTNAGILFGTMLKIVAHHPEWQENTPARLNPTGSFPSIDHCYKKAIRMWVAFPMGRLPMGRLNDTPDPMSIPGTDEVIPPGSFAYYSAIGVHYNEELSPNACCGTQSASAKAARSLRGRPMAVIIQ